jgi:hypothetical protein
MRSPTSIDGQASTTVFRMCGALQILSVYAGKQASNRMASVAPTYETVDGDGDKARNHVGVKL